MMTATLRSGREIPMLGLGTWQLTGDDCIDAVAHALELGYRHIDTAEAYGNHEQVRAGIARAGIPRDEIFLTSKVIRTRLHHDEVISSCETTLRELGTDYVDLYLVHWPNSSIPMEETLEAMSKLVDAGKARDIGVSNFTEWHLAKAEEVSRHPISVNQVEYHIYLNQENLLADCKRRGIVLTAYSPLGRGEALEERALTEIARAHGKSAAQVALRWLIQKGIVVIPKARSEKHLAENLGVLEFALTDEEVSLINSIGITKRIINPWWAEFNRS
jgi:2,5-diketo-D-gluconate reductase B